MLAAAPNSNIGEQIIPEVVVCRHFHILRGQIIPVYQVMAKNSKILTILAKINKKQSQLKMGV